MPDYPVLEFLNHKLPSHSEKHCVRYIIFIIILVIAISTATSYHRQAEPTYVHTLLWKSSSINYQNYYSWKHLAGNQNLSVWPSLTLITPNIVQGSHTLAIFYAHALCDKRGIPVPHAHILRWRPLPDLILGTTSVTTIRTGSPYTCGEHLAAVNHRPSTTLFQCWSAEMPATHNQHGS